MLAQMTFFFKVERGNTITKSIEIEFISMWKISKVSVHPLDINA